MALVCLPNHFGSRRPTSFIPYATSTRSGFSARSLSASATPLATLHPATARFFTRDPAAEAGFELGRHEVRVAGLVRAGPFAVPEASSPVEMLSPLTPRVSGPPAFSRATVFGSDAGDAGGGAGVSSRRR